MQKLVFRGFHKSFLGEIFQLVFLKPGHFDQQELNPYPAQEADHVFVADKNFLAKLLVANRFGGKAHDAASQLPLPKALDCFTVQLIHFVRLGNDSESRVTSFDQVYCRCFHEPFFLICLFWTGIELQPHQVNDYFNTFDLFLGTGFLLTKYMAVAL